METRESECRMEEGVRKQRLNDLVIPSGREKERKRRDVEEEEEKKVETWFRVRQKERWLKKPEMDGQVLGQKIHGRMPVTMAVRR